MSLPTEALRALEKDVEKVDALLSKSRKLDPDVMFGRVFIKHRETIAAILATASEQAPVAWGVEVDGGFDYVSTVETTVENEACKYGSEASIIIVPLYTSPAHTSEARDVMAARIVEKYRREPGWGSLNAEAQMAKARGFVDAAMRQEAE